MIFETDTESILSLMLMLIFGRWTMRMDMRPKKRPKPKHKIVMQGVPGFKDVPEREKPFAWGVLEGEK